MQIACERCSTSYVLDDALIPPQGAPVQCTRCGLVFTVKPAAAQGAADHRSSGTQMFGAIGAGPGPQNNSTQMFGAMKTPEPMNPRQTAVFGSPGAADAASAPPNRTMMFGSVSTPASPQPAVPPPGAVTNSTAVYGAVGQPPASAPASTVSFPKPGSDPKASSTMMFGAVGSANPGMATPPAASRDNKTALFGAVGAPLSSPEAAPSASKASSTQMFGAVPDRAPRPASNPMAATIPAGASPVSTMMFGAVPGPADAPSEPKPGAASTILFGERPAPAPAPKPGASSTMMFGAVADAPAAAPKPAASSTMVFGTTPAPASDPTPKPSSTMMFGAAPSPATEPAAPRPGSSSTMMFGAAPPVDVPAEPVITKPSSTMMFGAAPGSSGGPTVAPWQAPPVEPGFHPQGGAPEPMASPQPTSRPNLAGPLSAGPLSPGPMPFPVAGTDADLDIDPYAQQLANRNKRAGLFGVLVVAAVIVAGVAYWMSGRPKPPPPELVARERQLFALIEDDSTASLEQARRELATLASASPPNYLAPKADQLIATALLTADLRDQALSLQDQFAALERERKKADNDHSRADWRSLVNNAIEQMNQVKAKLDPLQEKASKLDDEQNRLLKELADARGKLEAEPAEVERAFGVYFALKGTENGPRYAKLYKEKVASDGWGDLTLAAAADQPRQSPETLKSGLAAAQAALRANHRLTRAKRLEAHLQLALRDFKGARETATELALQSPDDPRVKDLRAAIDAGEKNATP